MRHNKHPNTDREQTPRSGRIRRFLARAATAEAQTDEPIDIDKLCNEGYLLKNDDPKILIASQRISSPLANYGNDLLTAIITTGETVIAVVDTVTEGKDPRWKSTRFLVLPLGASAGVSGSTELPRLEEATGYQTTRISQQSLAQEGIVDTSVSSVRVDPSKQGHLMLEVHAEKGYLSLEDLGASNPSHYIKHRGAGTEAKKVVKMMQEDPRLFFSSKVEDNTDKRATIILP